MKTQVKLLDSAKQGNLDALVALINQPLEHRQIVASASLNRRCLTITAEAPSEPPGRLFFVDFVRQGINTLKPRGVERVIVQGKQYQDQTIAWHDQFKVDSPNLADANFSLPDLVATDPSNHRFDDPDSPPRLEPLSLDSESPNSDTAENLFSGHGQSQQGRPKTDSSHPNFSKVTQDDSTQPEAELSIKRPRRHRAAAKAQTRSVQQAQAITPAAPRLMKHAFGFLWASSFLLGGLLTVSVVGWFMPERVARTEWEYQIVSIADDDFNLAIQELGQEGWELAYARRAIAESNDVEYSLYEIILKRPKSFLD